METRPIVVDLINGQIHEAQANIAVIQRRVAK